ncbi:MAG: histidine phosphatase family protein [Prochlorothrix sp.]|nr:histidine phosphatase family protein [Prochlorothrix sp.]
MKTLYLLRHGATDWNATGQLNSTTDLDLSEQGRRDIQAIAPLVRALPLDHVFCSPRRRALTTAQLLDLPVTVTVDDRLRELDFGCFEGKTPQELAQNTAFQQWYREDNPIVPPTVESFEVVADRAQGFLTEIAGLAAGQYLAIAHGGLLRILLCSGVLGMPATAYRRLKMENGRLAAIVWEGDRPRLAGFNWGAPVLDRPLDGLH